MNKGGSGFAKKNWDGFDGVSNRGCKLDAKKFQIVYVKHAKINQIQFVTGNDSLSVNIIWNFLSVIRTPCRAEKFK